MRYAERLFPPATYWVLAGLFALSMLAALGSYLGPVWGVGGALVSLAVPAALFSSMATRITVTDIELSVGRARIELLYLGEATALDAAATRARTGADADARAYLVLRPYVATAVEVAVVDNDDPVPYWLVSTRRPRALAAALSGGQAS